MEIKEKLVEIFENDAFKTAAEEVSTVDGLRDLIAQYGLELTVEEVGRLCAQAIVGLKDGELDETDLEDVAGGTGLVTTGIPIGVKVVSWLIKNIRTAPIVITPVLPRFPESKK